MLRPPARLKLVSNERAQQTILRLGGAHQLGLAFGRLLACFVFNCTYVVYIMIYIGKKRFHEALKAVLDEGKRGRRVCTDASEDVGQRELFVSNDNVFPVRF